MSHSTTRRKTALTAATVAAAALAGTCPPARAATTLTWDANLNLSGAQGGSGTWANGAGGWYNGSNNVTWNNANVDSAVFAGTTAGTVTISGTATAGALNFNTPGYTIAGGPLLLGGGGLTPVLRVYADVTVNSQLLFAAAVTDWYKEGAGTLTLDGRNHVTALPLHLTAGAVAFNDKGDLPTTVYFDGGVGTSRLLYTSTADSDIGTTLNVDTTGTVDVQSPTGLVNLVAAINGAGLLVKAGAGTFAPQSPTTAFTGTVRVDAGTLLLRNASVINSRRVLLNGGTLALRADPATDFASGVVAQGPGNRIDLDRASTAGAQYLNHALGFLNVPAGAALELTNNNRRGLNVGTLSNAGQISLNFVPLTLTSSPLNTVPGNPTGTWLFGHEPNENQALRDRGLWLANGFTNDLNTTFATQTADGDIVVGVTASSGTSSLATSLTLSGAWRGGAASATSSLGFAGGTITLSPNLRFNSLTADRTASRPVRAWGNGTATSTLVFDAAFVADHTDGGTLDDGLGEVELSGVTWITRNSQSLPVVVRRLPASAGGGTHRAGFVFFDNITAPLSPPRWVVQTNDQTYDGGVVFRGNGAIQLDKNLTLTGRATPNANNQLQVNANRTVTLLGAAGTLTLAGDLGFAAGSRLNTNANLVVFATDPGAGYYGPNGFPSPDGGAVPTTAKPGHTLILTAGDAQGAGGARFDAPVTRLAELAVSGAASVSPSLPAGPQKVLSVLTRLSFTRAGAQLDLADNAAILRASPAHSVTTVRPLLTAGSIRSSAADADHALGYARAADVLPVPVSGAYTFLGQQVAADDVLVRYTVLADATLDGRVNFDDLLALAKHYNTTTDVHWSFGDFNYDNAVNFDDLLILAKHYNAALPTTLPGAPPEFSADLAAAFAQVPEPSTLAGLAACGFALSARRKRRPIRP